MVILVFILGLLPFAAGYGLTFVPKLLEGYMAYVTAAVFLILWFFLAKLGKLLVKKTFTTTGYLSLAGFIDLLVIVIQILFTNDFWDNQFGTWTSYFFSGVRPLGILIADKPPQEYYQILIYVCSYLIMLLVAFLGSVFTKAKRKDKAGSEGSKGRKEKSSYDGSGLAALAKQAEESKAELEAAKEEK